jgi:hypothetical protein
LQLAFNEFDVYGGEYRQFVPTFLIPMNFYYAIQRNDEIPISGIWSAQVFWKPLKKWTFYGEFLIDDIIVNNDPGIDDRAKYDDRLGINFSLRNANMIDGLNWELAYVRIWNRTYQSKNTYENYHFRDLGLGYPCASCEELKLNLSYWGFFPFYIESRNTFGRYGDVSLTDIFPFIKEDFPVSPYTENFVSYTSLKYYWGTRLRLSLDINYRANPNIYSNRFDERSKWVFNFVASYLISEGY